MANSNDRRLDLTLLWCGVVAPVGYFAIQPIAALFYDEYSFLRDDASTLGTPESGFPELFNYGTLGVGLLLLFSAIGVARSLPRAGGRQWIGWLVVFAIVAGAVGCLNACVFPLPHQRHTSGLLASIGMGFFVLPLVLPFVFGRSPATARIRMYFWINLMVLVSLVPIVSGLIQRVAGAWDIELVWFQAFLNNGSGLLQRVAAAVVFLPVGVLCWYLLSREDRASVEKQVAS